MRCIARTWEALLSQVSRRAGVVQRSAKALDAAASDSASRHWWALTSRGSGKQHVMHGRDRGPCCHSDCGRLAMHRGQNSRLREAGQAMRRTRSLRRRPGLHKEVDYHLETRKQKRRGGTPPSSTDPTLAREAMRGSHPELLELIYYYRSPARRPSSHHQ